MPVTAYAIRDWDCARAQLDMNSLTIDLLVVSYLSFSWLAMHYCTLSLGVCCWNRAFFDADV